MGFAPEIVEELSILALYDPSTTLEGIKVHKTAGPAMVDAAQRLYSKGVVTLPDSGYLTPLGVNAVTHLRALLDLLGPR